MYFTRSVFSFETDPRLTDYDTLLKNINDLKAGKPAEVPIYDFKSSSRIGYRFSSLLLIHVMFYTYMCMLSFIHVIFYTYMCMLSFFIQAATRNHCKFIACLLQKFYVWMLKWLIPSDLGLFIILCSITWRKEKINQWHLWRNTN